MTNTQYELLCLARRFRGLTAVVAFHEFYLTSQQPMKKVKGIYGELRRLARLGWLRRIGGKEHRPQQDIFVLTAIGTAAAKHRRDYGALSKQPTMRLVGGEE